MIYKKISGFAFACAFAMAVILFTGYGREFIPINIAKVLFLIFGAIAFILNLISYKTGKHEKTFNLFYWIGSIVFFIGLAFRILHWPFSNLILLIGAGVLGISFLLPGKIKKQEKDDDLLDNF